MKICVLGLEGAVPEILFRDERLVNLRRLMELGVYGALQGIVPPGAVPGWICMAASQDPGSLGIYGPCARLDRSYAWPVAVRPPNIHGSALWDTVAAAARKSILVAVPPNFPPRPVSGLSVGCFLAPDSAAGDFAWPVSLQDDIRQLVGGNYVSDITLSPGRSMDELRDGIFEMNRKQWELVRWFLREKEWDYFHFVDIGLDRVQRFFWTDFDEQHPRHTPANPYQSVIPDYWLGLDEQIGSVLELLDSETVLLLASANGMQRLDGGFAVNQWLFEEGLLVLNQSPGPGIVPLQQLDIDWARTRAWSDGGAVAAIHFNVQGREPQGTIPAGDYEAFREEVTNRLASLRDSSNRRMPAQVLIPEKIYRELRGIAPDLIVQVGEGHWSSIAGLGHADPFVQEMAESGISCGPGLFILTAPNCPLSGAYEGAHLLDLAPTVLDLAGYEIPASMQGRSLVAGMEKKREDAGPDNEQIIMDRLAGLGYV